jgi:predicted nucleic-acid-binding protein
MRYIDTNVILRFLVEKDGYTPELVSFFDSVAKGTIQVKCLDMVFFQVIFVLKSFYKVEKRKIINAMKRLLLFKGLKFKDKRLLERTLDLWEHHSDDIIDCYIVANMEKDKEKEIYSFDKKIGRLGVKTLDI